MNTLTYGQRTAFRLIGALLVMFIELIVAVALVYFLVAGDFDPTTNAVIALAFAAASVIAAGVFLYMRDELNAVAGVRSQESMDFARVVIRPTADFEVGTGGVQGPGQTEVLVGGVPVDGVDEIRVVRDAGGGLVTELRLAGPPLMYGDPAVQYARPKHAPEYILSIQGDVKPEELAQIQKQLIGQSAARLAESALGKVRRRDGVQVIPCAAHEKETDLNAKTLE